jgi:hypothetical protein
MAEHLVALSHALPDSTLDFPAASRIGYSRRVPASGRYFAGPGAVIKQNNYYQLAGAHVHALAGEPGKNDLWLSIRNPLPGPLLLAETVNCPKSGKRVEAE